MWQLQEAKAKFSQVVKQAQKKGPQIVSVHGTPEVVVISTQDYQKLTQKEQSFYDFFHRSPLSEISKELDSIVSERQPFNRNIEGFE